MYFPPFVTLAVFRIIITYSILDELIFLAMIILTKTAIRFSTAVLDKDSFMVHIKNKWLTLFGQPFV